MTAAKTRRTPKTGGVHPYDTSKGTMWAWKATLTLADGTRKVTHRRGFKTKTAAVKALNEVVNASDKGSYAEPSQQPLGEYLATWLDGLQLTPGTVANYRKTVRLHVVPYLGAVPLASLTPAALSKLYADLLKGGRRGVHGELTGEPLSASSVRFTATVLGAALGEAVRGGQLPRNPAALAKKPTAKQAKAPEMQAWTAAQLSAFLGWSAQHSQFYAAWYTLAMTGMRRGELLGLRWKDLDLDAGTITVRRAAKLIPNTGDGKKITEGGTKSGKRRVADIDDATVSVLKAHKAARGSLHLTLAKPEALVFGDAQGKTRHPEHFSRTWIETVARYRKALGEGAPPAIRLHDLRHTHASLLRSPLRLGRRVPGPGGRAARAAVS